ncbi:MAG: ribonuclease P protein component [Chthoniobacterales bacterium]
MSVPPALTFPKARRLTRKKEFDRVRQHGEVWRGPTMTLAVVPAAVDSGNMRAGIIASRKVGGAVVRNRVRRRLREILRKHQHRVRSGLWLVVILSARAGRTSHAQLEDEWLRLATRASILAP